MQYLAFFRSRSLWIGLLFGMGILLFLLLGLPENEELPLHARFPGKTHRILGQAETCLNCHGEMTGFAEAHNPQVIGCSPCHLGDPTAESKRGAHRDMLSVPGNLDDAFLTCGTTNCHQNITLRVKGSLMTSMSGVISVDRFVFGESASLDVHAHVEELSEASPVDRHLRQLCASCHLGAQKEHPGPVTESSRGGGCNACHLNYSAEALAQLHAYDPDEEESLPTLHPTLNLQVTNEHCFGCHSRSGRISTNYEGWHETQLTGEEIAGKSGYRLLADGRVFEPMPADIHHLAGLECVDCHSAKELMGDGTRYLHKEDAVKVRCEDCHHERPPAGVRFGDLDQESQMILTLRELDVKRERFVVGHGDRPLINVLLDSSGTPYLLRKNTGGRHELQAPAAVCTREGAHGSLTCEACHTEWAPQCVGCHTAYDPAVEAFDLLDRKRTKGKWVEYLGEFFAEAPTLGIVEEMEADSHLVRRVKTFIPGMIMTIDGSEFPGTKRAETWTFHRLFAAGAAHTTNRDGRSCTSCHNNPLALGYGRGELRYRIENDKGAWEFFPEYAPSEYDGLPQDAWTGFLTEPHHPAATRSNARPFRVAEQQRILTVGACLTCHDQNSDLMLRTLTDYRGQLERLSDQCLLPAW